MDLFSAVYENDVDAVYDCIFQEVNINGKNTAGNAAIHAAAHVGSVKLINVLCRAGADIILADETEILLFTLRV